MDESVAVAGRIHNRMPLILDLADYDRWLSSEVPPIDLLRPFPAEKMMAYEIGQQINGRGYDAPDIVDPIPPRVEGRPPLSCRSEVLPIG
jgi:putative SOS response-associated peptidase YedK